MNISLKVPRSTIQTETFNMMKYCALLLVLAEMVALSNSFTTTSYSRFKLSSLAEKISEPMSIDPNFEAHLANFLKVGSAEERPTPELAADLRKRFKSIEGGGRKAAKALQSSNSELAVELEELADELEETHERFVQTALWWDAWARPSPDLGSELREKERGTKNDPNFVDNLPRFMAAGLSEDRTTPDLPSDLRMLKYKNIASVKRIAASELRKTSNPALADEMEEMAIQIEESHQKFVILAESLRARKLADLKRPEVK